MPFIPCERTKHQLGLIDVHHKYLLNCKICNNAPPIAPYYFITSLQEIKFALQTFSDISWCLLHRWTIYLHSLLCLKPFVTCLLGSSHHTVQDDTIWHCTDKGYAYDRWSWMKKPWANKRSQGPTEREAQIFSNKIIETMGMHKDLPLWWSSALRCSNMWLYMYILAMSQQPGLQNVPSLWNLEIISTPSISIAGVDTFCYHECLAGIVYICWMGTLRGLIFIDHYRWLHQQLRELLNCEKWYSRTLFSLSILKKNFVDISPKANLFIPHYLLELRQLLCSQDWGKPGESIQP